MDTSKTRQVVDIVSVVLKHGGPADAECLPQILECLHQSLLAVGPDQQNLRAVGNDLVVSQRRVRGTLSSMKVRKQQTKSSQDVDTASRRPRKTRLTGKRCQSRLWDHYGFASPDQGAAHPQALFVESTAQLDLQRSRRVRIRHGFTNYPLEAMLCTCTAQAGNRNSG